MVSQATIKNNIDTIEHNEAREFLLVAFSSILRSVSNATAGFGNLMINKNAPPKDRIFEKFSKTVKDMIEDMSNFGQEATDCLATVYNRDSRELSFIDDETVPYAEYQKLSLW
jgi:hypothetical protein